VSFEELGKTSILASDDEEKKKRRNRKLGRHNAFLAF